jgi:signal transduction histidine kinase
MDRLQELLSKGLTETDEDRIQDFRDFAHATGNGLSEVFRLDGTRVFPSPSTAAQNFAWPQVRSTDSERLLHVESSGVSYWVLERPFSLGGQPVLLLAAAPETGNLVVLQNFWSGLLAWVPILLMVSCASGYWVSRRALNPVDRITAKARSISIRNLSERLPVAQTGDELQRLAVTCNEMLERLESAINQIKRFTADASHELRGPLSFTRTVAELALREPATDPASRKAFAEIVDEAAKAAVLLEEMLTLARADANPFSIALEPVDLKSVVDEVCALAAPIAKDRGLTLAMHMTRDPSVSVLGDFASLRRLLWILIDNAMKYTHPEGRVEVTVSVEAMSATLSVEDTGVGISATDLPLVFDRFYRADPSRGMVEGNGLGLAIAKWIAEMHGAEISVSSRETIGTTFQVTFPNLQTPRSSLAFMR